MYTNSNKRFYDSKGNIVGKKSFMESNNTGFKSRKLTDAQAIEILSLLKSNVPKIEIAKMFNVSDSTISQIEKNRTYCNIDRSKINPYPNFTEEVAVEKLEL